MMTIENLSFRYKRGCETLSGLSLSLAKGSVHGLLGCNGVGKTTLMKIMSGLLKPSEGKISVAGFNPGLRQPSFFRRMFLVPEEFDLPHVRFRDFVRNNSIFYPDFSQELLDQYANELGVDREAYLDNISMGERKKAYLAFVLACQPEYLFMDEPTNGLDIVSKPIFRSTLSSYVSPERTVVISTHQVADIQNIVDNIVILDREGVLLNERVENIGRRLKFGPVRDGDSALWSRDGLSGKMGISLNEDGRDSVVDIEMFFSAMVGDKKKMTEIMNR